MAEIDPVWLQGGNYDASEDRILISALLGAGHWSTTEDLSGVTTYDALKVSANGTPDMSVNVAAGLAIVKGTEATGQGYYIAGNDAGVNKAIAAADNTNDRHDIVYLAVRDAVYSGSDSDCVIGVATGIPAAVPADPDIPENAIPLARVVVQANASSITGGDITDLRTPSPVWTRPRGFIDRAVASGLDQTNITTEVAVSGCSITFDAKAGRRYKVTGYAVIIYTTAGQNALGEIKSSVGGTHYGRFGQHRAAANNSTTLFAASTVIDFPTDGSQTVMLTAFVSSGGGSITIQNSSIPAWIMVEDIGGFI